MSKTVWIWVAIAVVVFGLWKMSTNEPISPEQFCRNVAADILGDYFPKPEIEDRDAIFSYWYDACMEKAEEEGFTE